MDMEAQTRSTLDREAQEGDGVPCENTLGHSNVFEPSSTQKALAP